MTGVDEAIERLGARLRKAREEAGLSLQELSARTKIRASLLDAIEREDFRALPGGLLARGFLRAYAREVGLDSETLVRQFVDEFESRPPGSNPPLPMAVPPEQSQRRGGGRGWQLLAAAVIAAVTALLIYFNDRSEVRDSSGPGRLATIGSEDDSPVDAGHNSRQREPERRGDRIDVVVNTHLLDRLTVDINPTGLVWVQATADGTRVLYRLIQPGERTSIDAREELRIRVGDAGAFQYSINGVRGRPIGGQGDVRDIRITRDDYATFQDR